MRLVAQQMLQLACDTEKIRESFLRVAALKVVAD
jgi:hypothetical protein